MWKVKDSFWNKGESNSEISGGSRGGAPPPYFGLKKKKWENREEPAGQVNHPPPPLPRVPLAKGLDPPLEMAHCPVPFLKNVFIRLSPTYVRIYLQRSFI